MAQSDGGVDGFWNLLTVPWAGVVIILANCRTTCGERAVHCSRVPQAESVMRGVLDSFLFQKSMVRDSLAVEDQISKLYITVKDSRILYVSLGPRQQGETMYTS